MKQSYSQDDSIKKTLLKYIILKIENGDWINKIPSEHFFSIKFSISRSYVSHIMNILKQQKIIITIPKLGHFVNKKRNSLFYSMSHDKENIKKVFSIKRDITTIEKKIIDKIINDRNSEIDFNNFDSFKKYYTFCNNKVKKINISFLKKMKISGINKQINKSIFSVLASMNLAIFSKIHFFEKRKNEIYKWELFFDDQGDVIMFLNHIIENKNIFHIQMTGIL